MERRRALAVAAATAATTVGAVAAIATNFGLLGAIETDPNPAVGILRARQVPDVAESPAPAGADPKVTIRYEDIYLPAPSEPPVPSADLGTRDTVVVADEPGTGDTPQAAEDRYEDSAFEDRDDDEDEEHEEEDGEDREHEEEDD